MKKLDSKTVIYLLRHGEAEGETPLKRYIGQTDVSLTASGRAQARWWARHLSGEVFEVIYGSDLRRVRETIEILTANRQIPVHFKPELREIHLGQWEGKTFISIRRRFPDEFKARGLNFGGYRPPGGESFKDLQKRILPVFQGIVHASRGKVLIVAHAGVNRVILCHVLGVPIDHLFRVTQDFGCLSVIEQRDNFFRVKTLNVRPGIL